MSSAIACLPLLGQLVLLANAPAILQPTPQAAAQAHQAAVFTPSQLADDVRVLRSALEEGHSGLYRYTPKPQMDLAFDEVEKSLNRPLTSVEFYRLVAPVVAQVKCGHTAVVLPDSSQAGPNSKRLILPLQVKIIDGKIYVLRDFSGDAGGLVGAEVKSINDMPADHILETMIKSTPADGDVESARQYRLRGRIFANNLVDLLGLEAPYTVSFVDAHKNAGVRVVAGKSPAEILAESRARFPQDQLGPKPPELTFLDSGRIARMTIHQFSDRGAKTPAQHLSRFLKDSFEALKSRGTRTLILDLRDNGGGADELGKELLSYFVADPFQYYDDLVVNALRFSCQKYADERDALPAELFQQQPNGKFRMTKHPNWGINQPKGPRFDGRIFALINGGSFSTTAEFLSHLHDRKLATFIGEESGGGYYGNTSGPGLEVTLPNTGLKLRLPLMTYYVHVGRNHSAARGVIPDVPVHSSIQDLIEGEDKDLATALELARKT
jgi:hypothetical protein